MTPTDPGPTDAQLDAWEKLANLGDSDLSAGLRGFGRYQQLVVTFVCTAREAVPALIAALRASRKDRVAWKEQVEREAYLSEQAYTEAAEKRAEAAEANLEKLLDSHAEGGWMARALDAEAECAKLRAERDSETTRSHVLRARVRPHG